MQVYDYLEKTPAGQQTRENVVAFFKATEKYKLTKAEQLQAANLRPASAVEVHLVRCLIPLCCFSSLGFDLSFCDLQYDSILYPLHSATIHLSLSCQASYYMLVSIRLVTVLDFVGVLLKYPNVLIACGWSCNRSWKIVMNGCQATLLISF